MPIIFKGVNEGSDPMDLVATHQRLLVGAALRTRGPILELGVGWYSTPILHEIALATGRKLYTYDNNDYWMAQFRNLEHPLHELRCYGWWGEAYEHLHRGFPPGPECSGSLLGWGLVFVDHGQPCEREYAVRNLLDRTDVFVMHDTEEGFAYGYDRLLGDLRYTKQEVCKKWPDSKYRSHGLFRYQYTDRSQKAWTTVASNVIDVTKWFIDLPPVEPSVEVT